MKRVRLDFVPEWDGKVRNLAVAYARRFLWKTEPDYDLDDLIQEGRICFLRCCDKYPTVTSPSHFLSLFATTYRNRLINLAKERTRKGSGLTPSFSKVEGVADGRLLEPTDPHPAMAFARAELRDLLRDAPDPVARVIKALVANEEGERADIRPRPVATGEGSHRTRQTTNEFLCEIAGQDPAKVDLTQMVLAWVHGEPVPC